jgi:hypothetical protein
MKTGASNEQLLRDAFDGSANADFQTGLLASTIRAARRRRHRRRLQRATLAVVAIVAVAFGLSRVARQSQPLVPAVPSGYDIVHTQPLPAAAVVHTQPLLPPQIASTTAFASVVTTTPGSGRVRYVTDEELFALVAPRAAVLVRTGPHSQRMIFVDPPDTPN